MPVRRTEMTQRHTSPLKAFEAMAAGRPIVASDLPSSREFLRHGENALARARRRPEALAAGLARLLGDDALSERIARAAFEDASRSRGMRGRGGSWTCSRRSREDLRARGRGGAFLLTLPLVTPKIRGADEIEYFSYLRSLSSIATWSSATSTASSTSATRRAWPASGHVPRPPRAAHGAPHQLRAHRIRAALVAVLPARAPGGSGAGLGPAVAADGFSAPYVAAACYASWLYGGLGLLVVHDALRALAASRTGRRAGTAALWWGSRSCTT